MNQFRTLHLSLIWLVFGSLMLLLYAGFTSVYATRDYGKESISYENDTKPILENDAPIYAAIDTSSQSVYVFLQKQLWSYGLEERVWNLEATFDSMPVEQSQLEFGLNPDTGELLLWSNGVGEVYRIDKDEQKIIQIDRSFNHKNQFGHIPFFRESNINAFGGYGFWKFKNYITFYSPETREWTLTTVALNSPLPEPRNAYSGFYNSNEDAFYMFGGSYSVDNRPDDKNVEFEQKEDLWRFSYNTLKWEFLRNLNFEGWEFENPGNTFNVGKVNTLSTSVFSPVSNNYYIPFGRDKGLSAVFYLAAFNTKTKEAFKPVEIPLDTNQSFIITNYFYNPKTAEFVFIGKVHLTNQREYPVKIKTLPEDSLLVLMNKQESGVAHIALGVSFGGILIIALILMLRSKSSSNKTHEKQESNDSDNIADILIELSEHEKNILQVLYQNGDYMESHELEAETWPDITNYDYRRKLKNETIKSLNAKLRDKINGNEAIYRKKDPNDNRRFLYGLNEMISNSWKQLHKS